MEQNLYKALCVISTAYMKHVYSDEKPCALNLGPFHEKVKAHCKSIINNSDLPAVVFVQFDGYSGPETPAWECISLS
jgi:hypothetical protein